MFYKAVRAKFFLSGFLDNKETFQEYGYAFLIGLQGGHYEKEDKVNE